MREHDQSALTSAEVVELVRSSGLAVVATQGSAGEPQAALVGVAATDDGDVLFDTSRSSRKFGNLQRSPTVALVVTFGREEVTLQGEGTAVVTSGAEREDCLRAYVRQYPDGAERAEDPDICLVRVRLSWARLTDYRPDSFGSRKARFDDV